MGWFRVGGSSWRAEESDAQVIIFMVTLLIPCTSTMVSQFLPLKLHISLFLYALGLGNSSHFNFSYDLGLLRSLKQVD